VAHWRATEGPERELIFRQEHPPGLQGLSDFTDGSRLGHPQGHAIPHLLYNFWLAFSGWQYVKAICGGNTTLAGRPDDPPCLTRASGSKFWGIPPSARSPPNFHHERGR